MGQFLGQDPSTLRAGTQMDQAEQYMRDLQPWFETVKQAGADVVTPAKPPEAESLSQTLSKSGAILKWIVLAYLAAQFMKR